MSDLVRSMTGFARDSAAVEGAQIGVEIRSVNHRYVDFSIRAPRAYSGIENELRNSIQKRIRRGRIELSITHLPESRTTPIGPSASTVDCITESLKSEIAQGIAQYTFFADLHGIGREKLGDYLGQLLLQSRPRVDESRSPSESELSAVSAAVERAVSALILMRESEGVVLQSDLLKRTETLSGILVSIQKIGEGAAAKLRTRLLDRIAALAPDVTFEAQRIEAEVALLADRLDITEEITRVVGHLDRVRLLLEKGAPEGIGRKLDFLVQELNREFNTVGSKSNDLAISSLVVDAKAELERMREQIQNVE